MQVLPLPREPNKMKQPPLVSIGLPVFNGERFISQAINSILAQDFRDFELIIADNASTDSTPAICADFASCDARIRYVRSDRNRGAAWNLNRVVELALGRYFKWCAYDDRVSGNYVSVCVRALERDAHAVLAYGKTQIIDHNDIELARDPGGLPDMNSPFPVQRLGSALHHGWPMHEIHGVFRLSALRRSSLHRAYYGSDRALLAEMALFGSFLRIPSATFYCREHSERSCKLNDKDQRAFIGGDSETKYLSRRWALLLHLLEITRVHRQIAPRAYAFAVVLAWALTRTAIATERRLRAVVWKMFATS
jgi:glycosyltransferase involved in cell wall biosynthesis